MISAQRAVDVRGWLGGFVEDEVEEEEGGVRESHARTRRGWAAGDVGVL